MLLDGRCRLHRRLPLEPRGDVQRLNREATGLQRHLVCVTGSARSRLPWGKRADSRMHMQSEQVTSRKNSISPCETPRYLPGAMSPIHGPLFT